MLKKSIKYKKKKKKKKVHTLHLQTPHERDENKQ